MAEQEWYYALDGQQLGPVEIQVLQQLLANGNLQPTDLVWRQGMDNWQPAGSIAELNPVNSTAAPTPVSAYPVPPAGQAPYGTPLPYAPNVTNSQGRATAALVVSILGFFCFGIVLGPISIYLAVKAKANMARSGDFTGHGLAKAALVIGIVDIITFMLGVLLQVGIMKLR